MIITDVKIRKLFQEGIMKAIVSITIDNEFAVHDIKVIEGHNGLFVAMPSIQTKQGTYQDTVHPIGKESRQYMTDTILSAYKKEVTAQSANCTATSNCENTSIESIAPRRV